MNPVFRLVSAVSLCDYKSRSAVSTQLAPLHTVWTPAVTLGVTARCVGKDNSFPCRE